MAGSRKTKVTPDDFQMFDARAEQGREVARAVDRNAPMPHAVTIRVRQFETFLSILTPKRFELYLRTGRRCAARSECGVQGCCETCRAGLGPRGCRDQRGTWRQENRPAGSAKHRDQRGCVIKRAVAAPARNFLIECSSSPVNLVSLTDCVP